MSDPAADNYISITALNPAVRFAADNHPYGGMHGGFRGNADTLAFRVQAGTLTEGDTVTITYGDRSAGSCGLRMATISSDRMPLPCTWTVHAGLKQGGHPARAAIFFWAGSSGRIKRQDVCRGVGEASIEKEVLWWRAGS